MTTLDSAFLDKARQTEVTDEAFATMLAQSWEAFKKYESTLSDIEKQMIGMFRTDSVPEKFKTWVFYRVGSKALASTQALKHLLTQQGWQPVPGNWRVVMAGCEPYDSADGSNAEYLCAPQEVYRRQKAIEGKARNRGVVKTEIERMDNLAAQLESVSGVAVDEMTVTPSVEGSLSEFAGVASQTRDRAQARRQRG